MLDACDAAQVRRRCLHPLSVRQMAANGILPLPVTIETVSPQAPPAPSRASARLTA